MEDRDHNESSITRPSTELKNGVCVRIWIQFLLVIPFIDSVELFFLFNILDLFVLSLNNLLSLPNFPITRFSLLSPFFHHLPFYHSHISISSLHSQYFF